MRIQRFACILCAGWMLGVASVRLAAAAPPAYVHSQVRDRLREGRQVRVIVRMGDPALPQALARDWRERGPAIRELTRRVRRAAPRLLVTREYEIFPFLAGIVDDIGLRQLAACPQVEGVYPNREFRAMLAESGPLIGQPEAEAAGYDGTGATIAIVDTGIDYTHPDLGGSATINDFPNAKVIGGYNAIDVMNQIPEPGPPMDDNGHGTQVAGIAAGTGSAYRGMAPDARLVAVKVLDAQGLGPLDAVLDGIQWCIQNQVTYNIKVINLSLGDVAEWSDPEECDGEPEGLAIADALGAGIVVVAASGNEGHLEGVSIPACVSDAMAVGATWDSGSAVDTPPSYSNRGELLSLYAPGSAIVSVKLGGGYETDYAYQHGTSFASPHVAGAAAVLFERIGLGTSPENIRSRLERTGSQVVDPATGVGTPRVDLVRAIDNEPTSGPDLVVSAVTSSTASGLIGDSLTVSATVTNQGGAPADACRVMVGLSGNQIASPQDEILAIVDVPALAAGESHSTGPAEAFVPGTPPGEYSVAAFADAQYAVTEKNERNNGRVGAAFTVDSLSSYVMSSSIPSSMLRGQTYSVSVTLWNDGTAPWTDAGEFALGAASPEGTTRWGTSRVPLPGAQTVDPGGTATFTFEVTAPSDPGWHVFHWRMARDTSYFGELVTGASKIRVLDDPDWGQDFPALDGDWVAYNDASGASHWSVAMSNLVTGRWRLVPDDIPFPLQWNSEGWYEPVPPYTWFDLSPHWMGDVSGDWLAWMVNDRLKAGDDPFSWYATWYWQVTALNGQDTNMLPLRITWRDAAAVFPAIDGTLVVWEDYRNDPDRNLSEDFLADDSDIYICDVSDVTGPDDHYPPDYALCTAPGPQFAPRIFGDLVVWEDWRDVAGQQSDLYLYDLSVDTDGDGIPNWKDADRPDPDPAQVQLTDTPWPEEFPDISGNTVVWMDLQRDTGFGALIELYAMDIEDRIPIPVATDPITLRLHPRIEGTKVVWEDWRQGQPDIHWLDLSNSAGGPIAASSAGESWPDISADRVAYAKHRRNLRVDTNGQTIFIPVYNVWVQNMLPNGAVGVHTFTDVPSSFWAWLYVEAAVQNGVVQGFLDGTYQPTWVVTRDQMAVFISRALAGGDELVPDPISDPGFTDVTSDYWAYKYICYAVDQGVAQGFLGGDYRPADPVDRAQMAVYIARALAGDDSSVPPGPPTASFPDVPTDFWAYRYVEFIADQGVAQGYFDGLYHPELQCTRDQMAVYISRAFGYIE